MGAATSQPARWRTAYSLLATGALAGLAYFLFFHNGTPATGRARELILYAGNYPSPTDKFALHVEIDREGTVGYRAVEKESGQQAFAGNIGNAKEAWCLCWDGADNLWVCGELEGVVYVRVPGSDYRCYSLREKDYSKSMPAKFREFYNAQARE